MVEGPTWRYRHLEGDNGTGSQPWNAFLLGQEGRRGQQTANEGDRLSVTVTELPQGPCCLRSGAWRYTPEIPKEDCSFGFAEPNLLKPVSHL